jgi:hypothetical protein
VGFGRMRVRSRGWEGWAARGDGVDYELFEVVGEGGEEGGRGGGGGGRRGGFCFGSEARDDDAAGFIGFGLGWGLGEHGQGEESA